MDVIRYDHWATGYTAKGPCFDFCPLWFPYHFTVPACYTMGTDAPFDWRKAPGESLTLSNFQLLTVQNNELLIVINYCNKHC